MKEIDYFFEWMSPSEVSSDFGISEKQVMEKVQERQMRTQTTRHGEFQIFGQDLQAWYNELRAQQPNHPTTQRPKNRRPRRNPVHPSLLPHHDRIPSKRSEWGEKPIPIPLKVAAMMLGVSLRTIKRMIRDCTFAT